MTIGCSDKSRQCANKPNGRTWLLTGRFAATPAEGMYDCRRAWNTLEVGIIAGCFERCRCGRGITIWYAPSDEQFANHGAMIARRDRQGIKPVMPGYHKR